MFASPRGKLWAIRNFYRNVWTPAQQQAGVAFTLHDLRHTFASRLLAAGIPLIEVSAWMSHGLRAGGHEITNSTTRVCAHATGESRQAALDELATLIEDADSETRTACNMSLSDPHTKLTRWSVLGQLRSRLGSVGLPALAAHSRLLRPAKR